MPRISPAARSARRQELIDAAWRCAGRMGYGQITVDDICAEAQVSKGAFYAYFESKRDLLIALLDEDAAELDSVLKALDQRDVATVERVRSFAREMCARGSDQPRVQVRSDLWAAILVEPVIRTRMVSAVGRRRAVLRSWIDDAVRNGELAPIPANAFASVLLALGDGLTLHSSLDPSGFRWANITRVFAAIFAGLSNDEG